MLRRVIRLSWLEIDAVIDPRSSKVQGETPKDPVGYTNTVKDTKRKSASRATKAKGMKPPTRMGKTAGGRPSSLKHASKRKSTRRRRDSRVGHVRTGSHHPQKSSLNG